MKHIIGRRLAAAATIAGAIAFGLGAAEAETLRLAHHHAVGGQVDQTANHFAELVERKSGGELTVRVFPAAQLGQEREAFDQLNQGVIDASMTSLGLMDKYWEPIGITSLPFIWRSWDHAEHALDGEFAAALTDGMLENSDARLLGIFGAGFRDMLFREAPITQVADMEGIKMRSPEAFAWIRMFELLGARPTPVTWGEVYTAMQTGVAAGLESPALAALDMKFNEVTEALVRTQHMFATMAIAMNQDTFDSLSPEHQAVVIEAGQEAARWSTQYAKEGALSAYDRLMELGIDVLEPEQPEAWAAAMQPLWDEVAAQHPESQKIIDLLVETE